MSKMFDNYDNQTNCGCCQYACVHIDPPAIMLGWSGVEVIYDEKGNEVGLGFNQKSPITLRFSFTGTIINDYEELVDISEFISENTLRFELLDFMHELVYENEVSADGAVIDDVLTIKLNQEVVENLVPEIYYIRLTLLTDDAEYVLFTPHDGLIHIS